MKHLTSILISVLSLIVLGCTNNDDLYNEMPRAIETFVAQYYPNSQLSSFTHTTDKYRVVIKDGPTMVFDNNYQWTMLNGNGSPLPSNFLFNEMPPEVYSYLQETENLNDVFSVERDSSDYTIMLLDYTIEYNSATGHLTGDNQKNKKDPTSAMCNWPAACLHISY